jgi:hypothetical protein
MSPTLLVPVALFGWLAVVPALFSVLPPRRAVLCAYLGAWLFLPVFSYDLPGFPDYDKTAAAALGTLIGILGFDSARLLAFRARLVDLPMILWCTVPFASALANGLTAWDGASAVIGNVLTWGMPYLVGRLYFASLAGLKDLAGGIVLAGLVYVPLCLLEIRLSPQLHHWTYGFHQHSFDQTFRFGGYRPVVFLAHGLAVGFFMTACTLVAFHLRNGRSLRISRSAAQGVFLTLVATAILCKSLGALVLLAIGCVCTLLPSGARPGLIALTMIPILYMAVRGAGQWEGAMVVEWAESINPDRARSLQGRMAAENLLVARALGRPLLGWGGYGRNRVLDENGEDIAVTDGYWVIALGVTGLVGLLAFTACMLLPVWRFVRDWPPWTWRTPLVAPAYVVAMILPLFLIDCLLNAFVNPAWLLIAGGLSGLPAYAEHRRRLLMARRPRRAVPMAASR